MRRYLAFAILAATALMFGAAHAQPRRAVVSLLEMRQAGVVLQQWDLSCGAAALATLLSLQFEDHTPERDIAVAMMGRADYLAHPELVRVREGFSLLDLKRYVQTRGYDGAGIAQLTLDDLYDLAPLITPLGVNGYNHFVVVRGVRDGRVLIADPAFGNREMSTRRFAQAWLADPQIGHIGFIVTRRIARRN